MTEPKIPPLLEAALDRLADVAPRWHEDEQALWCEMFVGLVHMLYPAKRRRKSRARAPAA